MAGTCGEGTRFIPGTPGMKAQPYRQIFYYEQTCILFQVWEDPSDRAVSITQAEAIHRCAY